jgi:1-acyl-sn-glycerol-3-phosphate acyltransferase
MVLLLPMNHSTESHLTESQLESQLDLSLDRSLDLSLDLSTESQLSKAEAVAQKEHLRRELLKRRSEKSAIDKTICCWHSFWLTPLVYLAAKRFVPWFFESIEIEGLDHLPHTGALILAPTHRSRWDAILIGYIAGRLTTGRDLRFMVTIDECMGFQGWLIKRLGGFPVNLRQPTIASLRYSVEMLQNQEVITIFPEGGIFRDGQVHDLKQGLARMALQASSGDYAVDVKVVPIGIQYSTLVPERGTRTKINIGKPLDVLQYQTGSTKEKAKQLTDDLQSALTELTADPINGCK